MKRFLTLLFLIVNWHHIAFAEEAGITILKRDGVTNEIQLLDNRFRVDHEINSITLLVFREHGSPAVILVQPDGSKIYASYAFKNDKLEWFDEPSYDLITLDKPTPGPWQVIGNIQPNSRIMVVGDIELHVEDLPPLLFRGEMLKVKAKVTNDGENISTGFFRDVVSLYVDFVSTHNEKYSNFGTGTQKVTSFEDDGRGFDERPMDGIFTGQYKLNFPAGEWLPELYVETVTFKRRVVKDPLVIAEPPFAFDLTLSEQMDKEHNLKITLDDGLIKQGTVSLQGLIIYPNGEEQSFSLRENSNILKNLLIKNYGWGRYVIEISAFGENINGREFMAELPNYVFEIERPIETVPEISEPTSSTEDGTDITLDETFEEEVVEEPSMSTAMLVSIVVLGNVFILLVGWLLIRIFVQGKPLKFNFKLPSFKKKSKIDDSADEEKNENGSKNDKTGDILNLSMSDD